MLNIRMELSRNRMSMQANGHAGYAPAGQDIVCAAASTLFNTLLIALRTQMGIGSDVYF